MRLSETALNWNGRSGRFPAGTDLPGMMAYASSKEESFANVKSIALRVLADMIESGEVIPEPLKRLFAA